MALFDIFTGESGIKAAEKQRDYLQGIQRANDLRLTGAQTGGIEALRSGETGALSSIRGGFGTARGDVGTGTADAIRALYEGRDIGRADLLGGQAGGLEALRSGVSGAVGAYDPLMEAAKRYGITGGSAANTLADALGLSGPEGQARARAAFQTGPGYDFAVNQGLEAVLRNANASGQAAGGNQLRASQEFGQGLANQEFQNWLKNVAGVGQLYSPLEAQALQAGGAGQANALLTGGTGAANIYTGTGQRLSDLASTTGARAADIYGGQGKTLADLASRGGLAEAGVQQQTGQSVADLIRSIALGGVTATNTLAPQISNTYGSEAAAATGASKNLWNTIGNAITFAGSGGLSGLGSLASAGAGGLFSGIKNQQGGGGGMFFT